MRILKGIRMMMVRLITRAACHCEVRATCFPEGGVPTTLINISINQGDAYNGGTFIMRCIELYKRYTKWGA